MGSIYIKNQNFELKIEDVLFRGIDNQGNAKLMPHIAKLIDDLTDKFSLYDTIKTKKLSSDIS